MRDFAGGLAVITGAASGFGREFARTARGLGMRLLLADVDAGALEALVRELGGAPDVAGERVDVADGTAVDGLARRAARDFGAVNLLFNNAGVASGGYVWENSAADWQWVLGVNLMGVVNGLRHFVPAMLESSRAGAPAHIVNTASVAGWVCPPLSGIYNASKHAVVALTETLYHDLRLAGSAIGVSLLCPAFVPTGIAHSERNRPAGVAPEAEPTASQRLAHSLAAKAVEAGRLTAEDVARVTFDAIREERFYVFTHPRILPAVRQRVLDAVEGRAPADPYGAKPEARPPVP